MPGYSYFRMCLEKSGRNCITSYLYSAAILASFFLFAYLKACFRLRLSTRNKKKRTVTSKKHAYRPETSYCVYYSLKRIPFVSLPQPNVFCRSAFIFFPTRFTATVIVHMYIEWRAREIGELRTLKIIGAPS